MKDYKIVEIPEDLNLVLCIVSDKIYLLNEWVYDMKYINLDNRIVDIIMKKALYHLPAGQHMSVSKSYNNDKIKIYMDDNWGREIDERPLEDIADLTEILDGIDVILHKKKGNDECFTKYHINASETESGTEVYIKEKNTLTIINGEVSLEFYLDGNKTVLEKASDFFKKVYYDEGIIGYTFLRITFNQHKNHIGIKDIYDSLRHALSSYDGKDDMMDASKAIKICYHCSTEPFFILMEAYIKEGLDAEKIYKLNPYFTGKPYPNPKDKFKISKRSKEYILKHYGSRSEDIIDSVIRLESNPRISATGMDMFFTLLEQCDKIIEKCPDCWGSIFSNGRFNYAILEEIFDTFEISMKTLIDRSIKAIFQNSISTTEFINLIYDYIRMCKIMGIKVDKKLPKNVISQHDIMSLQIKDIQDKKIKADFANQVRGNRKLLEILPDSPLYTIISPDKTNDLIAEGRAMNHCVGSYIDRVASGSSKIYFLRKKDAIDNPYVTIELDQHNGFVQAKAFSNTYPSKDDMKYIYNWIDMIGGYHE